MRFLSADAVFDGQNFLEPGSIVVLDEKQRIADILPEHTISSERLEKHKGCLTPGFVNTHCHLELSHLKGKLEQRTGFPAFAKQLIRERYSCAEGEILEHMQDADRFILEHGTVAVGDICNTALSFRLKADSKVFYHSFIELLSLDPGKANETIQAGYRLMDNLKHYGLSGSLAPHAPYSVSQELFSGIQKFCEEYKLPCTIHNQESLEEIRFLTGQPSGMEDLFAFLNIDLDFYKAPGVAGLSYLGDLMPKGSILVHNTFSNEKDLEESDRLMNYWCFCPRANLFIENSLPDFKLFSGRHHRVCLGTDSLASNINLDLVQDANLLLGSGCFNLKEVLTALTSTGARALGLYQQFGSIRTGTQPGLNLLHTESNVLHFIQKIC